MAEDANNTEDGQPEAAEEVNTLPDEPAAEDEPAGEPGELPRPETDTTKRYEWPPGPAHAKLLRTLAEIQVSAHENDVRKAYKRLAEAGVAVLPSIMEKREHETGCEVRLRVRLLYEGAQLNTQWTGAGRHSAQAAESALATFFHVTLGQGYTTTDVIAERTVKPKPSDEEAQRPRPEPNAPVNPSAGNAPAEEDAAPAKERQPKQSGGGSRQNGGGRQSRGAEEQQVAAIDRLSERAGMDGGDLAGWLKEYFGVEEPEALTYDQASNAIKGLQKQT